MDTETPTLIAVLRDRMTKMPDSERLELIEALSDGYCLHCGACLPCFCNRDD